MVLTVEYNNRETAAEERINSWKIYVTNIQNEVKSWKGRTEKAEKHLCEYKREMESIRRDQSNSNSLVFNFWEEFTKTKLEANKFYEKTQGRIAETTETSRRQSKILSEKLLKTEKLLQQSYLDHERKISQLKEDLNKKNLLIEALQNAKLQNPDLAVMKRSY